MPCPMCQAALTVTCVCCAVLLVGKGTRVSVSILTAQCSNMENMETQVYLRTTRAGDAQPQVAHVCLACTLWAVCSRARCTCVLGCCAGVRVEHHTDARHTVRTFGSTAPAAMQLADLSADSAPMYYVYVYHGQQFLCDHIVKREMRITTKRRSNSRFKQEPVKIDFMYTTRTHDTKAHATKRTQAQAMPRAVHVLSVHVHVVCVCVCAGCM